MKKLRNIFIVLIALILIFCFASIIVFRNNIDKANEESISKKIVEISSISYDKISLKVNDDLQTLGAIASQIATFSDFQSDEAIQYAALQAQKLDYERIVIVDKEGNGKFSGMKKELNVSDRDYFKKAIKGEAHISKPIKSYVTGKISISVATPIIKNNQVIGIIYGILDSSSLYSYLGLGLDNVLTYAFSLHEPISEEESVIGYGEFFISRKNDTLAMNSDIITVLNSFVLEKGLTTDTIMEQLSLNGEMQFSFEYQGEKYYGHLKSFEKNDSWCFFNVISEKYVSAYVDTINEIAQNLIIVLGISFSAFLVIISFFFIVTAHKMKIATVGAKNNEERLRLALEISKNIAFDYDFESKAITYQSANFSTFQPLDLKGHIPEALFQLNIIDQCSAEEFNKAFDKLKNNEEEKVSCDFLVNKMGESVWYRVNATNLVKHNQHLCTCSLYDISAEKAAQARVLQEKEYKKAISERAMLSFDIDLDTRRVLNGGKKFMEMIEDFRDLDYETIFKFLLENNTLKEDFDRLYEFFSQKHMCKEFSFGHDFLEIEFQMKNDDNKYYWVKASVHIVFDMVSKHRIMYGLIDNITEQKNLHDELQNKAEIDELTQLINRAKTVQVVNDYIANKRPGVYGAFIILDLDNFKMVNDSYGHMAGDVVLKEFAANIRKTVKAYDDVGRLGGDEFVVLMKDFKTIEDIYSRCKTLNDLLSVEFTFGDSTFTQRCSIGVTIIDNDTKDFEELYNNSDRALYTSKRSGKSKYTISDKQMPE